MGLLFVNCFLEFGPGGKFCHFAGGNLNGCAGLRVAPIPCLPLRNRESAETNQGYPISFSQGSSNAVHRRVNSSSGRGLTDARTGCDFVNEIGFIRSEERRVGKECRSG